MANSNLSELKFVVAEKPQSATISPAERRRIALVARIDEQIALATAQLEERRPEFTRTKTVVNKETGEKSKVTASKNVRPWYWQHNSKFLLTIRYGLNVLKFAKGTNAIEAPSLKGIVTVLNTVKSAVEAGELDSAITALAAKREKKSVAN
jgi:hypothetical protein